MIAHAIREDRRLAAPAVPRGVIGVACAYLALAAVAPSPLPWNMRWADLLFIPLSFVALRLGPLPFGAFEWAIGTYLAGSAVSLVAAADRTTATVALAKQVYAAGIFIVFVALGRRVGAALFLRVIVWTATIMAAVGLACAALSLVRPINWPAVATPMPLPYVGTVVRVLAGAGSPEMFVNFLTFAVPVAMAVDSAFRHGPRRRAAIAILLAAALLTFGQGLAGLLVALAIAVWPALRARPALRGVVAAGVIGVVLIANLLLAFDIRRAGVTTGANATLGPPPHGYALQPPAGAHEVTMSVSFNPMSYLLLKKIAIESFIERPWIGYGLGSFHSLVNRAVERGAIQPWYANADAHGTWTGRLAETGLVGGATLIGLWIAAWFALRQYDPGDRALGRALWAGLAGLAVNSINADIMNFRFLWVGLAALRILG